jgi:hypothetical protein
LRQVVEAGGDGKIAGGPAPVRRHVGILEETSASA